MSMVNDYNFDSNALEVDAWCACHDIDDYDLYGEIKAKDGDGSDFGWNIDFDY